MLFLRLLAELEIARRYVDYPSPEKDSKDDDLKDLPFVTLLSMAGTSEELTGSYEGDAADRQANMRRLLDKALPDSAAGDAAASDAAAASGAGASAPITPVQKAFFLGSTKGRLKDVLAAGYDSDDEASKLVKIAAIVALKRLTASTDAAAASASSAGTAAAVDSSAGSVKRRVQSKKKSSAGSAGKGKEASASLEDDDDDDTSSGSGSGIKIGKKKTGKSAKKSK